MTSPIVNHIAATFIPVSDINKSKCWYCDILGTPGVGDIIRDRLYIIPLQHEHVLVLDKKIYSKNAIKDTPLFQLNTQDIHAAYRFLLEKEVEFVTNIQVGHWFTFKDPDGNILMVCKT
ncbi:VOC family protein [Bacillus alkalicellulosilyticus]|uniref:VOC family protein n=1 Tax=Alkalihalobacterium alkalicellulosilyticum TaxID=1912214 RepID=UPI000996995B|nr:VOC family protein [Bacillus alkalicellulosilyticus]